MHARDAKIDKKREHLPKGAIAHKPTNWDSTSSHVFYNTNAKMLICH